MRSELLSVIEAISDTALQSACLLIFEHPDFLTHPAAKGMHHAYTGGLAAHTREVISYALHIAELFPNVDRDVLIAATLWHDVAKVFEYEATGDPGAPWATTDYRRNIGHIAGSSGMFTHAARKNDVDRKTEEAVVHAILAHHGPVREWGSPVAPNSLEALILHQADMLSAKHGATA
jgi:3'-5' exoribonuclease